MTTDETRNKRRREGAAQPPSIKVQSPQDTQSVLDLEAIREIVAQEIRAALDPMLDALTMLETETRKTRVALDCFRPQLGEDEAGEEEWLAEQQEGVEQESQASSIYSVRPRGRSGRTSFRAGLPVKEPVMLEILPRQEEVK